MPKCHVIDNIYRLAQYSKMDISKVEKMLGVHPGYFSRVLRLGKLPKLELILQICEWYGCTPNFICYTDLHNKSDHTIEVLLRVEREKYYAG